MSDGEVPEVKKRGRGRPRKPVSQKAQLPKRPRGRPRKSESEKAVTRAKRAARKNQDKVGRGLVKAQNKCKTRAVTHGHPPLVSSNITSNSTWLPPIDPQIFQLSGNLHHTQQLLNLASATNHGHSHPERPSNAGFAPQHPAAHANASVSNVPEGESALATANTVVHQSTNVLHHLSNKLPPPSTLASILAAFNPQLHHSSPQVSEINSASVTGSAIPTGSSVAMQNVRTSHGAAPDADQGAPIPPHSAAPAPLSRVPPFRSYHEVQEYHRNQIKQLQRQQLVAESQPPLTPAQLEYHRRVRQLADQHKGTSPAEASLMPGMTPSSSTNVRRLSNDMLVYKLRRAGPGLECDWCRVPSHYGAFGDIQPKELSERAICSPCGRDVLYKLGHVKHGSWRPVVPSPQAPLSHCDVCPIERAAFKCGDCPLIVCTTCQTLLDCSFDKGNLNDLIEGLSWLGTRDDAVVLHSGSQEFPNVAEQSAPPTTHLVQNRYGDWELLTEDEMRAEGYSIDTQETFAPPTVAPGGHYDEHGRYMGGLHEEGQGLLAHEEFWFVDPSAFDEHDGSTEGLGEGLPSQQHSSQVNPSNLTSPAAASEVQPDEHGRSTEGPDEEMTDQESLYLNPSAYEESQ